jgi:hypothetical protein
VGISESSLRITGAPGGSEKTHGSQWRLATRTDAGSVADGVLGNESAFSFAASGSVTKTRNARCVCPVAPLPAFLPITRPISAPLAALM